MADGLSVAGPVVGIATATLATVQFLYKTIDNIKGAPETVRNIKSDLQAVEQYSATWTLSGTQITLSAEVRSAAENCQAACTTFQAFLDRWMRHSTEDKTFWVDRWRLGLFGQQKVKAFRGNLNNCKNTLSVALSTATIIATIRQEGIMTDIYDFRGPKNAIAEGYKDEPLILKSLLFTLPKLLSLHAFRYYKTLESLLDIIPPKDTGSYHIKWSEDLLEKPFYSNSSQNRGGEIEKANSFDKKRIDAGVRACFPEPPTIHDWKANASLFLIDKYYSEFDRMRAAAYENSNIYGQSYQSSESRVDGQNTFLDNKRFPALPRPHDDSSLVRQSLCRLASLPTGSFWSLNRSRRSANIDVGHYIIRTSDAPFRKLVDLWSFRPSTQGWMSESRPWRPRIAPAVLNRRLQLRRNGNFWDKLGRLADYKS